MSTVIDRLRARKVTEPLHDGKLKITLPIFGDWLRKHAELALLPIWRRYVAERSLRPHEEAVPPKPAMAVFEAAFPIPEDDLLSVSQNLVFCGKQKDVAEIRSWLRQFDDENRIEIAFALLKRLAEKGYVSDGARGYGITKLVDGVNARRLELASGKWMVARGRKDNLCLSYVDSDLKSGASLVREVTKLLGPGKSGDGKEISNWITTHVNADPIVVLLDDFSATGSTICKGLARWKTDIKDRSIVERLLNERRIMLILLNAWARQWTPSEKQNRGFRL